MNYCACSCRDFRKRDPTRKASNEVVTGEVIGKIRVDVRTISNIERNAGNPTYENLYALIHVLGIDSREIFDYDEMHNAPTAFHLQQLLYGCSEREAQILMDISKTVLNGMRTDEPTK